MASKFSYVCNIILMFSIFAALFIRWVLGWQLQRKNFDTMMLWFDVKPLTEPEQHSPEFVFCPSPPLCLVVLFVIKPFDKNKDNNNKSRTNSHSIMCF